MKEKMVKKVEKYLCADVVHASITNSIERELKKGNKSYDGGKRNYFTRDARSICIW